jgi:hypothetical protein
MAERRPSSSAQKPASAQKPGAVVFGASVAGLTAAHELANRGFDVSVVAPPGEIPGGSSNQGWTARTRIASFARGGRRFPAASPVPADACADPIPAGARHLLDTLASIPAAARGKRIADELIPQPWSPLRRPGVPLPIHPRKLPRDAGEIVDGAKAFVGAGYTAQDGHTFVARTLRYLTSSARRRAAECETVSMLDYLRGANAAAVPASCEYSAAFLADLQALPDPVSGARPSVTDARTGLGAYAQSLAADPGPNAGRHRRFPGATRRIWFEPWLAHLRDQLGVKFLAGRLARLAAAAAPSRAPAVTARVAGCSKATQQRIARAAYLIVATGADAAEAICATLPSLGVPGDLEGFGARPDNGGGKARADADARARWEAAGGVQLFLPDRMTLDGPLAVVGSPWRLVIRPQLAFHPRPPGRVGDRFACVLAVDVGAWDEPSPRTGTAAIDCDGRQLAHEIWAQIDDAQALQTRGRPRPPSFFALDSRVQVGRAGRIRSLARRLLCLPGDWANRPGPSPGAGAAGRRGRESLWTDRASGGVVHWNRLVFAGDYLKTHTRSPGPEAECESGRRAANAAIAHARARHATATDVPKFAAIFDPETLELASLNDLRKLDDWCAREKVPHPFALAGVDGWISLVSWFGVLYPVSEPFLKTVLEKLLAMARSSGGKATKTNGTGYQEAALDALRGLREALQREFGRARP